MWVAAYGPKALQLTGEVADGFILQLADPDITAWTIKAVREAAEAAGRDPDSVTICVAAPAYVGDDLAHARDQCRWFGGMVGNHVADIVARYGTDSGACPRRSPTTSRAARTTTTTSTGGPATRTRRSCPTASSTASASSGRPPPTSSASLELKSLGVDQFAIYLQHDSKESTLQAYGRARHAAPWPTR